MEVSAAGALGCRGGLQAGEGPPRGSACAQVSGSPHFPPAGGLTLLGQSLRGVETPGTPSS